MPVEKLVGAIGSAATVSWLESGHDFPRSTAKLSVDDLTKGSLLYRLSAARRLSLQRRGRLNWEDIVLLRVYSIRLTDI